VVAAVIHPAIGRTPVIGSESVFTAPIHAKQSEIFESLNNSKTCYSVDDNPFHYCFSAGSSMLRPFLTKSCALKVSPGLLTLVLTFGLWCCLGASEAKCENGKPVPSLNQFDIANPPQPGSMTGHDGDCWLS